MNYNHNKAGFVILYWVYTNIIKKKTFNRKNITEDKNGHFIMIKYYFISK